jgi:hypothetical protein
MQVHDGGTQFYPNISSQLSSGDIQLRNGETALDNGCNLIIVGMPLKNSQYAT